MTCTVMFGIIIIWMLPNITVGGYALSWEGLLPSTKKGGWCHMESIIGIVIALLTLCGGCFKAGYTLGKDIAAKADKKTQKK